MAGCGAGRSESAWPLAGSAAVAGTAPAAATATSCAAPEGAGTGVPGWLGAEHHRAGRRAGTDPRRPGPLRRGGLGCAGVTSFNAVRKANTRSGGKAAAFGLGGLGHLTVQFAARLGYETVAIARGADREHLAHGLGARHYIDSTPWEPGTTSTARPGSPGLPSRTWAAPITSCAPLPRLDRCAGGTVTGLRAHGRLTLVGVDAGSPRLPVGRVVGQGLSVTGHLTGSARETEETMAFAVTSGVRPMAERMPLEDAGEAVSAARVSGPPRRRPRPCTCRTGAGRPGPPRAPCTPSPTAPSSATPSTGDRPRRPPAPGLDRDGHWLRRSHRRRLALRAARGTRRPALSDVRLRKRRRLTRTARRSAVGVRTPHGHAAHVHERVS